MNQDKKSQAIKEAFLKGLSLLLALVIAIIVFFVIFKFQEIFAGIKALIKILMPIIIGIVFAYLVHPVVEFFEEKMDMILSHIKIRGKGIQKIRMRLPAILITFVLVGFVLYLLFSLVVPQLYSNIWNLIYTVPKQITRMYYKIMGMMEGNTQLIEIVNKVYDQAMDFITGWVKKDMFNQITLLINGVLGVAGVLSNMLIGCIVAIYILMSKETFARQFNMLLHAFFSDGTSNHIKRVLKESDRIFGGFISGKIIDSLIIGVLCFFGASILHLPYVVLVSVIVGATNIIPFFGPYIGAVPSAILIFLYSPTKGLVFIVFIVILQQFDGNILGPKILGDSTGLSPFWVIFSILLGSGLFGVIGMIIGVPAFGVIYYLVKSYIHYRLELKKPASSEVSEHERSADAERADEEIT